MIRVLIAVRSAIARAGLESLLASNPDVHVVSSSAETSPLGSQMEELQPDVALIEAGSPDDEDLPPEITALAAGPNAPAILLLADDVRGVWTAEALRSGVHAVLPRDVNANELLAAVEAAAAGLIVLDPQQLDELLPAAPHDRPAALSQTQALTPREIEVLRMLAEGLGNKEIAWRLGISEHTVKFHVASLMGKLNAGSRTEAVTLGIRRGLIML